MAQKKYKAILTEITKEINSVLVKRNSIHIHSHWNTEIRSIYY